MLLRTTEEYTGELTPPLVTTMGACAMHEAVADSIHRAATLNAGQRIKRTFIEFEGRLLGVLTYGTGGQA